MSLGPGFDYQPGFLQEAEADSLLATLWRELEWQQYEVRLFGRWIRQPRLSAWCSDDSAIYRYSGLTLLPAQWHPALDRLRGRLHEERGLRFNSVLANAYRHGQDSMGWHADDEPELGAEPSIASLSLGSVRRFLVRSSQGGASRGIDLQHGSLLLMGGKSQHETQHAIPRTRKNVGLRINLTYRCIQV